MKKLFLSAFLLFLAAFYCSAQVKNNGIINTTGGQMVISGNTYEFSIGEATLTNTAVSSGLVVTQGLLQPMSGTSGTKHFALSDYELQVYPNPAREMIYVRPNLQGNDEMLMTLYDINGQRIYQSKVVLSSGDELQSIWCSDLPSGIYVLEIRGKHQQRNFTNAFKISKIN